ncbi:MAG: SigB/SigF/SigG family RNA polymerase sigma factor [[Eubacterium] sulci]|jgi:RNA polymerase sigma-70 factor, sigma-B/F/G subfamily|nr:SigB/SigF/SigG family RNA polymerase sigma factor [[Eubacterium] sulci]MBF1151512.1 SigB/SigF/SigG family RNA polymerase sigma factor [[Eubacterium] sulci]MBF1161033.1 SigB/SigF/SigG family RNA polymerase sigma factor [[Eubacterium] sulci]MBF1171279.1 SigB/SigF/SigG family RNA polymerase sigma factor [[Eubacterium] sulci]MBF1173006.1 SigB/SigF/SigG family RNA polymerase sigma factor [[Eubacterium] sulci]
MIDQELFEDYKQNPTIEKRNALVEKNLYMVDILIRKYLSKGVEYDDLYQIGALALVAAVERFDPAKGFEFSSFATPTILGEIKKYFRDKQWSLKVPRRLKEIAAKVQDAKDKLNSELHRTPTVAEIAEFTGYTEEQIIEAIESSHAYGTYSLDKTFDEAGEDGENAFLEKYTGFNEHGYDQIETAEIINKVVNTFNDQYKFIFRERFINNKSQSEIAKSLGISQMTVSRAEKNIVGKFRAELFR